MLTGPGEEGRRFPQGAVALSAAITLASRAKDPCTFYVRDGADALYGYVELCDDGVVRIYGRSRKDDE